MMALLVIGVGLGAAIALWHRERMREVEEQVRAEMETKMERQRKVYLAAEVRLYDEIVELMGQIAALENGEKRALTDAYQRGRMETRREMSDGERFVKAYERQRVFLAMKGVC